jgi:hypothetical protein
MLGLSDGAWPIMGQPGPGRRRNAEAESAGPIRPGAVGADDHGPPGPGDGPGRVIRMARAREDRATARSKELLGGFAASTPESLCPGPGAGQ